MLETAGPVFAQIGLLLVAVLFLFQLFAPLPDKGEDESSEPGIPP